MQCNILLSVLLSGCNTNCQKCKDTILHTAVQKTMQILCITKNYPFHRWSGYQKCSDCTSIIVAEKFLINKLPVKSMSVTVKLKCKLY